MNAILSSREDLRISPVFYAYHLSITYCSSWTSEWYKSLSRTKHTKMWDWHPQSLDCVFPFHLSGRSSWLNNCNSNYLCWLLAEIVHVLYFVYCTELFFFSGFSPLISIELWSAFWRGPTGKLKTFHSQCYAGGNITSVCTVQSPCEQATQFYQLKLNQKSFLS